MKIPICYSRPRSCHGHGRRDQYMSREQCLISTSARLKSALARQVAGCSCLKRTMREGLSMAGRDQKPGRGREAGTLPPDVAKEMSSLTVFPIVLREGEAIDSAACVQRFVGKFMADDECRRDATAIVMEMSWR